MFLDIQGHLGQVQGQRQPGVSQRQEQAKRKDTPSAWFQGKAVETKVVQYAKMGCFQMYPDIKDHLGQLQTVYLTVL